MRSVGEALRKLGQQLYSGWSGLRLVQRATIGLVGLAVFGALLYIALRTGNPDYAPLYTNLDESDAAGVVQALREAGVSYRLAENGTAILVPKQNIYQTRLDLAAKGLPKGGVVGFEIFQQFSFGSTDFERNVKYTWALQGELTRTIRELEEVADARVHIAIPEKSLFIREQRPPTASVMLQLRPGARLSPTQVNGIAYLVARSVESMQPENVTVIDTQGNVLSKPATAADTVDSDAAMQHLDIQRTFERDIEQHLQSMLEPVYGEGRAIVRVKADMNFDSEEETLEIYEPAAPEGLVRSSKTQEEISDSSTGTGGVSGASSNTGSLAGYVIPQSSSGNSRVQKKSAEVAYEVNRTQRKRITAPGKIMGLSVAVWIDGNLSQPEKDQVRNTVLAAISGSERRADIVSVESMPFRSRVEREQQNQPVLSDEAVKSRLPFFELIGAGALLGAIVFGTLALFWRRSKRKAHIDLTLPEVAATVEPEAPPAAAVADEAAKRRKAIEAMAKERPSDFATLVQAWLAED